MKYRTVSVLVLLMIFAVSVCAWNPRKERKEKPLCPEWMMPDSTVYARLGKRLAGVLFAPQNVRCYRLVGKEKVMEGDVEIESNFVRDTLLSILRPDEVAVLQYALIRPQDSYATDSVRVMSPYLPVLEFEFCKNKETAHVIISLSDMTWTVMYDDKRQFNYNYANEHLLSQFCRFYLGKYNSKAK